MHVEVKKVGHRFNDSVHFKKCSVGADEKENMVNCLNDRKTYK